MTVRRLGAYDAHCLRVETPARPGHLGVLAILDGGSLTDAAGRLRFDELRDALAARSAEVPQLRRVVLHPGPMAGGPIWVDDPDFRIERHVKMVDVPPPGTDEALLAAVAHLVRPMLDRSRPLWRMWFLTGLEDGRVAALIVLHHALADGLAAMAMARSLLEGPMAEAGRAAPRAEPRPGWSELARDNLAGIGRRLVLLARPATWALIAQLFRQARQASVLERREPASVLNGPVGPNRRLSTVRLPLALVKRVARQRACGVNDILLDLIAVGIRSLLEARGADVTRLQPRVGMAVALARGRGEVAGNAIGSVLIPLPLGIDDRERRLAAIRDRRARAKASPTVVAEPLVRAVLGRLPAFRRRLERQRLVNVAATYLPGPTDRIAVLGAPVLGLLPVAPLAANLGLSFVALSYAGDLRIAIRADADRFPDLPVLVAAMDQEWRGLARVDGRAPSIPRPRQRS